MDIHLGATAWSTEGRNVVPLNATTMKGIFEIRRHALDNKQDTLRWCFAQPNQPRPISFNADEGSGQTSVELRRFIVDEDEIVAKLEQAGATVYKDKEGGWVTEIVLPISFDSKVALQTLPDLRKLASIVSYVADKELSQQSHWTLCDKSSVSVSGHSGSPRSTNFKYAEPKNAWIWMQRTYGGPLPRHSKKQVDS